MTLPSKWQLAQLLGSDDFFLWQYYGKGALGKIQAWIFRSRIETLMKFLRWLRPRTRTILDVGCGPMLISYPLAGKSESEYVGVDIMPADRLKKYRNAMRNIGIETVEVVRASAERIPFRNEIFDFALSLDVLEHLSKPKEAVIEIYRVVDKGGMVAISLPLENLFQRLIRVGFLLMKISGDPILKRAKPVPITRTPEYHYVGNAKSYDDMVKVLEGLFNLWHTRYTPLGVHRSVNVNAVHILRKK